MKSQGILNSSKKNLEKRNKVVGFILPYHRAYSHQKSRVLPHEGQHSRLSK